MHVRLCDTVFFEDEPVGQVDLAGGNIFNCGFINLCSGKPCANFQIRKKGRLYLAYEKTSHLGVDFHNAARSCLDHIACAVRQFLRGRSGISMGDVIQYRAGSARYFSFERIAVREKA